MFMMCAPHEKQFPIDEHVHMIHVEAVMWTRIGAVALCFPGLANVGAHVLEGFVFTGQDKAVVVPGDHGLRGSTL